MIQNLRYFGKGRERRIPSRKHTPDEIIGKLREAEIVLAEGGPTAEGFPPIFDQRLGLLSSAQGIWWFEARSSKSDEGFGERECAATPCDLRLTPDKLILPGPPGRAVRRAEHKLLSPARRQFV